MIKKIILAKFFLSLIFSMSLVFSDSSELPHQSIVDWENKVEDFFVRQRLFAWKAMFDIETKTHVIGRVDRKVFTLLPEYYLVNVDGEPLAKAKMKFWSLGAEFDICNERSELLGNLKQKITWLLPSFTLQSPTGQKLAEASLNFWGTKYTIVDSVDGHGIATLSRPFFRLGSNWSVHIEDLQAISKSYIHPHVLLTLVAFQADREYWQAMERQNKNVQFSKNASSIKFDLDSPIKKLRKKTELFRKESGEDNLTKEDVAMAESLAEQFSLSEFSSDEEGLVNRLNDLFESPQLTQQQKITLSHMVECILQKYS